MIRSRLFAVEFEEARGFYTPTLPALPQPAMKNLAQKIVSFLKEEDGPTAVEYAVMLALIVVVCLTAIGNVGTNAKNKYTAVSTAISN